MKRIIVVLSMLGVVFSKDLSAGETPVISKEIRQVFSSNFPRAENASFEVYGEAILVTYFENCKHNLALYKEDGELIGTGSYISKEEIPSRHLRTLQKKFGVFEIMGALEFSTIDQSYYGLQLATEKGNVLVRVYENHLDIVKNEQRP